MPRDTIRVGLIGASSGQGWASISHVPALHALPQYEIVAVATSRTESAEQSAGELGLRHAYTDPSALARNPDVDLVTVSVKVPSHDKLVREVLDAGKHVYCEWPLARTSQEASALLALAQESGVLHAIGLQARYSPPILQAWDLIAGGYLGRVTSVTVYSALEQGAGARVLPRQAYTLQTGSGVSVLSVAGGHTLDAVLHLVGDNLATVSATLSTQQPHVTIEGTGEVIETTVSDHVLLTGTLTRGAVFAAHISRGKRHGARTVIEISGTDGDLRLQSSEPVSLQGIQMQDLRLFGARAGDEALTELEIPTPYGQASNDALRQPALNVAQLYAQLADDICSDRRTVPGFAHAVRLHQLLDTIEHAATSGRTEVIRGA